MIAGRRAYAIRIGNKQGIGRVGEPLAAPSMVSLELESWEVNVWLPDHQARGLSRGESRRRIRIAAKHKNMEMHFMRSIVRFNRWFLNP